MKTIRLLYPDHIGGGRDYYYFGANLLQYILPENPNQPLIKVNISPPSETDEEKPITNGIKGEIEILEGIRDAQKKLEQENPDKVITIGGNCIVSLAPFDYMNGKYHQKCGILWIDAHPDISTINDGYPRAHAMVLGSLLGHCSESLTSTMKHPKFKPEDILYIGLQKLHDYEENFLQTHGIHYKIQDKEFLSDEEIKQFMSNYDSILVHLDVDVLDERFFYSTYLSNPNLVEDDAIKGKMKMEQLNEILQLITQHSNVVAFTIAEYLPYDEYRLHKMFSKMKLFTE